MTEYSQMVKIITNLKRIERTSSLLLKRSPFKKLMIRLVSKY